MTSRTKPKVELAHLISELEFQINALSPEEARVLIDQAMLQYGDAIALELRLAVKATCNQSPLPTTQAA